MHADHFFDSYALVAILEGNPAYERFAESPIVCERYNLYEVAYYLLKQDASLPRAERELAWLRPALLVPTDEQVLAAASLRLRERKRNLSYVDALGYTLALEHEIPFLTGDRAFKAMEGVEFVPVARAAKRRRRG